MPTDWTAGRGPSVRAVSVVVTTLWHGFEQLDQLAHTRSTVVRFTAGEIGSETSVLTRAFQSPITLLRPTTDFYSKFQN